jgi:Fibronectin type III domain
MKYSQKTKYFFFGAIATTVLAPLSIWAVNTIPITFAKGDVLSASVMNNMFSRINSAVKLPSASDFVGTWSCTEVIEKSMMDNVSSSYTLDSSDLFATRSQTVTITAGSSTNALNISTSNSFPFTDGGSVPTGRSFIGGIASSTRVIYMTKSGSATQYPFTITSFGNGTFSMTGQSATATSTCISSTSVPAPVNTLSVTTSGTTATLTWTDSNGDNTGYIVQRSTDSGVTWSTVSTITSSTTYTYTDSGLSTGTTYYYQVLATNSNGNSVGSSTVPAAL